MRVANIVAALVGVSVGILVFVILQPEPVVEPEIIESISLPVYFRGEQITWDEAHDLPSKGKITQFWLAEGEERAVIFYSTDARDAWVCRHDPDYC